MHPFYQELDVILIDEMIILYENFPQKFFSVVVITEKCIKNISFEAD